MRKGWVIPPEGNSDFVAQMEIVLDIYRRPYNENIPVICMDETPKQLINETKKQINVAPGKPLRYDYEYQRQGVCNIFMASEPLAGKRIVSVTQRKTKSQWAYFVESIAKEYNNAEKIILVMDNYNTHKPGSFYEVFLPEKAKKLLDRFEFVYTPKHGSWLNMAEIELSVLSGQCLNRRIDNIETVINECKAWQENRNNIDSKINWQFTTKDSRVKLKRLYPTLHS